MNMNSKIKSPPARPAANPQERSPRQKAASSGRVTDTAQTGDPRPAIRSCDRSTKQDSV